MKQLNEQQLQTHVPIVGWLLIAYCLLHMVLGLFVFALIMSGNAFSVDLGQLRSAATAPDAVRVVAMPKTLTALTATLSGGVLVGLAIPALVAGIAVLARKSWARILGIVVSVFTLLSFPLGTLVGAYAIFVLMQDTATNYFASPPTSMQTAPRPA